MTDGWILLIGWLALFNGFAYMLAALKHHDRQLGIISLLMWVMAGMAFYHYGTTMLAELKAGMVECTVAKGSTVGRESSRSTVGTN